VFHYRRLVWGGYFSCKVSVMSNDAKLYDAGSEAQSEGISLPVSIDGALIQTLTPSPYLESLGVPANSGLQTCCNLSGQ
jgi:hypothetical protein